MKIVGKLFATSLAAVAFSSSAQTKIPGLYGELGYTALKYSEEGININPAAIRGILGYEANPNFSVEGMLALGVTDDSARVYGVDVKAELVRSFGLYLKPKFMATDTLEIFGRLGFASSKLEASVGNFSVTESDSSVSYGIGAKFNVSPRMSFAVDYMSYYNKDGAKANGFTVGLGTKF